jgi:small GTP-binding protein
MSSSENLSRQPRFKVVFVGDCSVGKTSIIMRYCGQPFSENRPETIASAFIPREVNTEHGPASLQIWDTAGQERYRSLVPMYCQGAAVSIVVFDLSNRESFDDLGTWIDQVHTDASPDCKIIIAANKVDLTATIEINEIDRWAYDRGFQVVYVSARTGENISLLFDTVIGQLPPAAFRLRVQENEEVENKANCC